MSFAGFGGLEQASQAGEPVAEPSHAGDAGLHAESTLEDFAKLLKAPEDILTGLITAIDGSAQMPLEVFSLSG